MNIALIIIGVFIVIMQVINTNIIADNQNLILEKIKELKDKIEDNG